MAPDVLIQNEPSSKSYNRNIKYALNKLYIIKYLNTAKKAYIAYDLPEALP